MPHSPRRRSLNAAVKSSPATAARRKTKLVLGDQVIVSGANFVIGLLLARALGPTGYGQFVLNFNIILFAYGINIALINSPMLVLGAGVGWFNVVLRNLQEVDECSSSFRLWPSA